MSTETDHDFVITRLLDAPRELVFKAWTDPHQIALWWGPKQFSNTVGEMDVKPGGTHRIVMHAPDGVEYPIKGFYREVVPPERLVMTLDCSEHPKTWHDLVNPNRAQNDPNPAGEMVSTITFEARAGKTLLTIRTRFHSVAIRDAMLKIGMTEGWSESLERLGSHLFNLRALITTRTIDAPRELVFKMWTEPQHVVQWWGPNGFTTTIHEMDVRPGGAWRFIMHGPDGVDYPNEVIYLEVTQPARLVYMHTAPKFHKTVHFDEQNGKTKLTMIMLFDTAAERDEVVSKYGAAEGARQTLERLSQYLLMH